METLIKVQAIGEYSEVKKCRVSCVASSYGPGCFCSVCFEMNKITGSNGSSELMQIQKIDGKFDRGDNCKGLICLKIRGNRISSMYVCNESCVHGDLCDFHHEFREKNMSIRFNIFKKD